MVYAYITGGTRINITSANEHVPDIEYQIIVVKEITRAVRHRLPSNKTPKIITIYTVSAFIRMLKNFPVKRGVSFILSLKIIMSDEALYYKQHLGLKIGQYFQVHEYEYPMNSQVPRTKGSICLGPIGINNGGYYL